MNGLEQVPVEPGHLVGPEESSLCHLLKQVSGSPVEITGIVVVLPDYARKQAVGQQSGILCVQAEDDLIEVVGQFLRIVYVLLQFLHNFEEQVGGFPGYRVDRSVGAKLDGRMEGPSQLVEVFLLVEGGHRNLVPFRRLTRKIRLDADGLEGRNYEQRGRLQVDLVPEELVQCAIQFRVGSLELPAEIALQVGVGEPSRHPLLESECF